MSGAEPHPNEANNEQVDMMWSTTINYRPAICAATLWTLACDTSAVGGSPRRPDSGVTLGCDEVSPTGSSPDSDATNTQPASAATVGEHSRTSNGSGATAPSQASRVGDAGTTTAGAGVGEPSSPSSDTTRDATSTTGIGSTDGGASSGDEFAGEPVQVALAQLPSVRQEHGVVALGSDVYVLGGFTPEVTNSVQAFSPASNEWRDVASFPVSFHHPNVAAVDGKIYVAGFLLDASLRNADGRVYAYDPQQDAWSERTPMTPGTERGSACVTTLGARIYVFGGAASSTLPDVSAYHTELDTWEELPFMPELREHCVAATIDGKIYIVSGRANGIGGLTPKSYEFDPVAKTYTERAPIPTARGGAAGATLGGRVFVFGGEGNDQGQTGVFARIEAYEPNSNAWTEYPAMSLPRHGLGAATVDNRVYLPGGGDVQGFGAVDDVTAFYFETTQN